MSKHNDATTWIKPTEPPVTTQDVINAARFLFDTIAPRRAELLGKLCRGELLPKDRRELTALERCSSGLWEVL